MNNWQRVHHRLALDKGGGGALNMSITAELGMGGGAVQAYTKLGKTRDKNNACWKADVNRLLKSMEYSYKMTYSVIVVIVFPV